MTETAVLIPHYNNTHGLLKSVSSIDSTEEIDIVIVDDGSLSEKFNESEINLAFKAKGKITYHYLGKNQGIEAALNLGLAYIIRQGYKYTARLDAGDLCVKGRFEIQKNFLQTHPNIKLIGSNVFATDTSGKFLYNINHPEKHSEIKKKIYINSTFVHPSVMFLNEIIPTVGMYPTNYNAAEDYAFFFKIVRHFETANLQQKLLYYEINPEGISLSKRKQQMKSRLKVIWDNFTFGFYPIYGLVRNAILFIIPNYWIQKIKRIK